MYRPLLALLLFAGPLWAAPPTLDIPAEVRPVGGYVRFTPKTDAVSVVYVALDAADPFPAEELKDAKRFLLPSRALEPGRYRFVAVAAGSTGEQTQAEFVVVIPGTPKPVPPGPGPGPTPPVPPAAENPFGAMPGLRVLVVYETADTAKLPGGQFLILQGKKFRDYLDAKCVADGYRMFDKDVKFTDAGAPWADALKRTDRTAGPWLYAGKEGVGFSGPLPADPDAAIAVIDKLTGGK